MADLDDIEAAVTEALAGGWSKQVEGFRKALLAKWTANGQTISLAEIRGLAASLNVRPPKVDATRALLPAAVVGDARVTGATAVALGAVPKKVLADAAAKPGAGKVEMLKRAGVLDLSTVTGLLGVVGPLGRSVADMEGAATYAVQAAANEATVSAAAQVDQPLVFVAERDACLECNARAGDTGDALMSELPPLHPHCRCEVQPYDDPAVVEALKREALRSILRGFSLPSESEAKRIRAAAEALKRRPNAPESVKRYARQAVRDGKFPRGRDVPGSS